MNGLLLSGGRSRRMGTPKGRLKLHGKTLIEHGVDALSQVCDTVAVVLGAHYQQLAPHVPPEARIVEANCWHLGMRESLRVGLRHLPDGHVIVNHVDRPGVSRNTIKALTRLPISATTVPIYRGKAGHPVVIPSWLRPVIEAEDTRSLREILGQSEVRKICVDDPQVTINLNNRSDWHRFLWQFRQ